MHYSILLLYLIITGGCSHSHAIYYANSFSSLNHKLSCRWWRITSFLTTTASAKRDRPEAALDICWIRNLTAYSDPRMVTSFVRCVELHGWFSSCNFNSTVGIRWLFICTSESVCVGAARCDCNRTEDVYLLHSFITATIRGCCSRYFAYMVQCVWRPIILLSCFLPFFWVITFERSSRKKKSLRGRLNDDSTLFAIDCRSTIGACHRSPLYHPPPSRGGGGRRRRRGKGHRRLQTGLAYTDSSHRAQRDRGSDVGFDIVLYVCFD